MWVEFIVGSLPCSKRFFSEHSSFPISLKKTHASKFQFDLESTNTFEGVLKNSQMFVGKQITILFFFSTNLNADTTIHITTCPHYNGQNSMSYGLIGAKYNKAVLDTMFAVAKEKG